MRKFLNHSPSSWRTNAVVLSIALSAAGTAYAAAGANRGETDPKGTPPAPSITSAPPHTSESPQAQFSFTDSIRGVVFHCQLDGGPRLDCSSPWLYSHLVDGEHAFSVWASVGESGRLSPPATYGWKIDTKAHSNKQFAIAGNALSLLYPGAAPTAINLTLSNPNAVAIYVTALQATVTGGSTGCSSAANIALTQSNVSSSKSVQVPSRGSVTLPTQGVSTPTIQLRDLPVNQDACKGAKFAIAYTGSAHS